MSTEERQIDTIVSHYQLPDAIKNAKHGQQFFVRTYAFRQVAEHKAAEAGREDIKFVVKRREE